MHNSDSITENRNSVSFISYDWSVRGKMLAAHDWAFLSNLLPVRENELKEAQQRAEKGEWVDPAYLSRLKALVEDVRFSVERGRPFHSK